MYSSTGAKSHDDFSVICSSQTTQVLAPAEQG